MEVIHIGKIIKGLISEKKLPVKEVVKFMNMSESNLYDVYNRASIDIDKVAKFSILLDFNLFERCLSKEVIDKIFYKDITKIEDQNKAMAEKEIADAKTIADMRQTIDNQRKLLAFYEQRLKEFEGGGE